MSIFFNNKLTTLGLLIATSVGGYTLFQTPADAINPETNLRELAVRNISITEDSRTRLLTKVDAHSSKPFLLAKSSQPYIGQWSNGRGETLSMTPTTIKFGKDRKLTYKNVTRVTDGTYFEIQITSSGKINYFQKFLSLKVDGKQMKMIGYNSYKDMHLGQNQGLEVNWYRD
ncbi:MAG: hypothetical protein HC862_12390 [Scytonema sp. RU_4_4]|nr:hypothetical protein [Scytonema sp. RU_4_4]NJR75916.1 hypothetical protein [Scytonema sp. CRU_2_7]